MLLTVDASTFASTKQKGKAMKAMKPATQGRNIISSEGGEPFTVHQHIILKNYWEYYLGETNGNGVALGYVMGFENEWGSVYLPEIEPYIITKTTNLEKIMPPAGYRWED
jgi:hypothetical protein